MKTPFEVITNMKTPEEIEAINQKRKQALDTLGKVRDIMAETGCSLGADIVSEAINELFDKGCDEY